MGVKVIKRQFTDFKTEASIRFDFKYINSVKDQQSLSYSYKKLFDFIPFESVDISELDNFKYAEIGNVNKKGEINPIDLSFELRDEQFEQESLFKKIEKGDIIKPEKGDILLSKIRPYLNKNILINRDDIFFTKAFIQIRPKINSEILYLIIRHKFIHLLNAVSRQGKGYPTLNEDDIKTIKFPKTTIDNILKNEELILERLNPIKEAIRSLKQKQIKSANILNKTLSNYFEVNLEEVERLDAKHFLPIPFKNVGQINPNLRSSFRWNKMQYIQSKLYSNLSNIEPLSRYITFTKNGWSPVSVEGGEGTAVLGQENFSSDGVLDISPSKATEETRNNIEDFYIKEGDFFVSRGNTVDLVALASIVKEEIENDIIYPDLYIKVEFDETKINKEYVSYIFNSLIGRLYFKYVSKGKNQTMVKVSSIELLNFMLPVPPLEEQIKIVEEIKIKLAEQEEIDSKIEEKQQEINKIIEEAIIGKSK